MDIFKKTALSIFISASLVACGGGGGDSASNNTTGTTYKIENGAFQKGPFVAGTTVTIQELSDDLKPTGIQYTATTDDTGHFNISNVKSRFVEVFANGFYFDELTNLASNAPVTLRAILDLTESSSNPSINALTTLQVERLRELVKNGQSLQTAKADSKNAVLAVFGIDANSISNLNSVNLLGVAQSDEKLLRATVALLQTAKTLGGSAEANLTTIVSKLSGDLKNDGLPNESAKELAISLQSIIPSIDVTLAKARLLSYINEKAEPIVYKSLTAPELAKAASAFIAANQAFVHTLQIPRDFDLRNDSNMSCTNGSFTISRLATTASVDDGSIQYAQCLKANGAKWNGTFNYQENQRFADYVATASNLSVENAATGIRLRADGEWSAMPVDGVPNNLDKGSVSVSSGTDTTKFNFPDGLVTTWQAGSGGANSGHGVFSVKGGYATNCIDGVFSFSVVSTLHKADRGLNGSGGSLKINSGANELGTVTFNADGGVDVMLKNGSKSTISKNDFLSSCGLQYDIFNSIPFS